PPRRDGGDRRRLRAQPRGGPGEECGSEPVHLVGWVERSETRRLALIRPTPLMGYAASPLTHPATLAIAQAQDSGFAGFARAPEMTRAQSKYSSPRPPQEVARHATIGQAAACFCNTSWQAIG